MGGAGALSTHRWECAGDTTGLEWTGHSVAIRARQCHAGCAADASALTLSAAHGYCVGLMTPARCCARLVAPLVWRGVGVLIRKIVPMSPAESSPVAISGTTRLYGIMGYPVTHSLSPMMQTFAFRQHNLDCVYLPFPVPPAQLAQAVAGAVALGVGGFNVTIPHKEAIVAYVDEVATAARAIGAVNTVHVRDGRTIGYNTDGEGFLQPLRALHLPLTEIVTCLLGAGGAARAVAMALLEAGCPVLVLANRPLARAERFVAVLQEYFAGAQVCTVP